MQRKYPPKRPDSFLLSKAKDWQRISGILSDHDKELVLENELRQAQEEREHEIEFQEELKAMRQFMQHLESELRATLGIEKILPPHSVILLSLLARANVKWRCVWPSAPTIAKNTGYHHHTVRKSLNFLVEKGWLTVKILGNPKASRSLRFYFFTNKSAPCMCSYWDRSSVPPNYIPRRKNQ